MTAGRRAVLAVMAGGLLVGCTGTKNGGGASAASSSGPAGTGTGESATPAPTALPSATASTAQPPVTRAEIVTRYGRSVPHTWGFDAPGVVHSLPHTTRDIALTFDACGGPGGSGYDRALVDFLRARHVPATLFLNSRWIDANPAEFHRLAADPLFEIANHGTRHRPLSVTGRSAYGIPGTRGAGEVYDEIAGNRDKLTRLLGAPPRFFRSGTAYCDDVAARIVTDLGERFVSFSVNGDGGATFTAEQVHATVASARAGAVVLCHMNHPEGGTARGIASAVPHLLATGHRFVRLSDALHRT
ncbi:peptidoglycan/xylan/chitin deacetylase (PgdA/CDA1 family) [Streptomyces puniciscabiei]|uniref:Peptidoglycan/xylan/chitin deacetylase (PgdA/CDA1 family) n=1 Tax=Streptomyces puniciscabiei TaxID=164348 RepID=A0A542SZE6_9ACTN|nr:polysaccharide deacetylase family protein [Streptomyces puniciscabiei]TQK79912.1 peptidoglycan/xylan/chitin deacetylase (PgdA/CDA1 family) [Streptomyces puniciscabiei]